MTFLCLFILALGASSSSAHANLTNETVYHDFEGVQSDDGANFSIKSTDNNSDGPKLDIKGPKIHTPTDIKGPNIPAGGLKMPKPTFNLDRAASKYNEAFKKFHSWTDPRWGEENGECYLVCNVLMEIYEDYNPDQTKQIAYKVFANNNYTISNEKVDWCFDGICEKVKNDDNGRHDDYFKYFHDKRRLIESDRFHINDTDYKKYSDYFYEICVDNCDYDAVLCNLILKVYKDYDIDTTLKVVAKILNNNFRSELEKSLYGHYAIYFISNTDIMPGNYGMMYDSHDIMEHMDGMRKGCYGADFYKEIHDVEMSKLPIFVEIVSYPFTWTINRIGSLFC